MNISYIEIDNKEIGLIKPLWEKLKIHHHNLSTFFPERYIQLQFDKRKSELLKKRTLKIDLVKDEDTSQYVGYCVSSISDENIGEIDSIFIEENYRSSNIGNNLMKRAISWMDKEGVETKKIIIAVGNEELIPFYQKFNFHPRHIILEQK